MSEAEIPKQPSAFESESLPEILMPSDAPSDPGWVTIDFPNAMSVDDIPQASEAPQPVSARILELEERNEALLDQIAKLERDLEESKLRFTTEAQRMETLAGAQYAKAQERSQQQEAIIKRQQQDLTFAAARIRDQDLKLSLQSEELEAVQLQTRQLTQDLDTARQSAQKQQILVETLDQQLQSSQEQVARLERDCALLQQKFTEQATLIQQSEQTCRDLRSRLLRQQRYTLQFKVALEKCLDVSPNATGLDPAASLSEDLPISPCAERHAAANFIKAQPVQPWSSSLFPNFDASDFEPELVESTSTEAEPEFTLNEEDFWATDSELEAELAADQTAASLLQELQSAQQAELRGLEEPTLAVEANVNAIEPASSFVSYTIQQPAEAAPSTAIQPFAAFATSFMPAESNPFTSDETEDFLAEASEDDAIAVSVEVETDTLTEFHSPAKLTEAQPEAPAEEGLFEPQLLEPQRVSSPFITLKTTPRPPATQPERELATVSAGKEAPTEDSETAADSGPSPIVYPKRSLKKVPSLAAVDLPSFPRLH